MMEIIKQLILNNRQLIKYGIIGSICASLDFIIYSIQVNIYDMPYLIANVISVHCGIITSFFLNRHFTFKIKNKVVIRLLSFYSVGLLGLGVSSVFLVILIEKLQINEMVSKAATVAIVALIQFLLNKYISFKHEKK